MSGHKVTMKETLALVNEARENLGMPLLDRIPVGFVSQPDNCPIHNAFGDLRVEVSGDYLSLNSRDSARIMAQTFGTKVIDAVAVNKRNIAKRNEIEAKFSDLGGDDYDGWDNLYDQLNGYPVFDEAQRWHVVAPPVIRKFVSRFDNGEFPSIDADHVAQKN